MSHQFNTQAEHDAYVDERKNLQLFGYYHGVFSGNAYRMV